MILTRTGNKRRIASKIIPYFPEHDIYVEPFFGAGGMFFNKPLAKYNFLNDLDSEVVNLYDVISQHKERFVSELERLPIHETLFNRWKAKDYIETDAVMKAIRFIFLSNFSYLGKMDMMRIGYENSKKMILGRLDATNSMLRDVFFTCRDFRTSLKDIAIRHESDRKRFFVYCDPPYLGTSVKQYGSDWSEKDTNDLFELLVESTFKFAISEFNNPIVLDLAKKYGLNVIEIGERPNLKNRKTEILITNYETKKKELFDKETLRQN